MTLTINDTTMTSDQTTHSARHEPSRNGWELPTDLQDPCGRLTTAQPQASPRLPLPEDGPRPDLPLYERLIDDGIAAADAQGTAVDHLTRGYPQFRTPLVSTVNQAAELRLCSNPPQPYAHVVILAAQKAANRHK